MDGAEDVDGDEDGDGAEDVDGNGVGVGAVGSPAVPEQAARSRAHPSSAVPRRLTGPLPGRGRTG
ncbi:hypothetical protein GCM10009528_44340 [Kineococcus aurantiacus]